MNTNPIRPYCCTVQFDGLKPLMFGTVFMPHDATQNEIEAALWKAWDGCVPIRPRMVKVIPGAIFFVTDEEYEQFRKNKGG